MFRFLRVLDGYRVANAVDYYPTSWGHILFFYARFLMFTSFDPFVNNVRKLFRNGVVCRKHWRENMEAILLRSLFQIQTWIFICQVYIYEMRSFRSKATDVTRSISIIVKCLVIIGYLSTIFSLLFVVFHTTTNHFRCLKWRILCLRNMICEHHWFFVIKF